MKKKIIVLSVVICLMLLGTGLLQAQTAVTLGAHYWRANFEFSSEGDNEYSVTGNMFGPYLNLRYGRLSLGSSIFMGSFDASGDDYDDIMKRTDMNFSLGLSLTRGLNVFGAIKRIKVEEEYSDIWGNSIDFEVSGTLYGGGLSLFFPIGLSPFFLTGSVAYLTDPGDLDDNDILEEGEGDFYDITAITISIGYHDKSGITAMVGYRADYHSESEAQIAGILATLAFTIR